MVWLTISNSSQGVFFQYFAKRPTPGPTPTPNPTPGVLRITANILSRLSYNFWTVGPIFKLQKRKLIRILPGLNFAPPKGLIIPPPPPAWGWSNFIYRRPDNNKTWVESWRFQQSWHWISQIFSPGGKKAQNIHLEQSDGIKLRSGKNICCGQTWKKWGNFGT